MPEVNLKYVNEMSDHAKGFGFTVTSTTGGNHNSGSKHGKGLAIDVRTKDKTPLEVDTFIKHMRDSGYKVLDERIRPQGQKVWSGEHLHVEPNLSIKQTLYDEWEAMGKPKTPIFLIATGIIAIAAFAIYKYSK